jgi:hypothetical protein
MPKVGKYHQGFFHPRNPEKYAGDPNNIIYRSLWEFKFMRYCDQNPNIIKYGSEEIAIPYYNPIKKRVCNYYPDFIIMVENNANKKTYLIEVKPKKQTVPPKKGKRVTKSYIYESQAYEVNQSKWNAAREWCQDRLIEFKIITEDELKIK